VRTLTLRRSAAPIAVAATLLAAFIVLFSWPQSAAAHDSIIASDPAADSTVETLPEALTLTFSAALIDGNGATEIEVTDATGQSVTDGPAELDGAVVTQPLLTEAAAGEYHVEWKVVSSDGHPTDGDFRFTVTSSTLPTPEPTSSPTADETAAPAPDATASTAPADDASTGSEASFSPGWLIGGGAALIIVVVLLILLLRRRTPADSESAAPESDAPTER